jgi:hypothetical protein
MAPGVGHSGPISVRPSAIVRCSQPHGSIGVEVLRWAWAGGEVQRRHGQVTDERRRGADVERAVTGVVHAGPLGAHTGHDLVAVGERVDQAGGDECVERVAQVAVRMTLVVVRAGSVADEHPSVGEERAPAVAVTNCGEADGFDVGQQHRVDLFHRHAGLRERAAIRLLMHGRRRRIMEDLIEVAGRVDHDVSAVAADHPRAVRRSRLPAIGPQRLGPRHRPNLVGGQPHRRRVDGGFEIQHASEREVAEVQRGHRLI